MHFSTIIARLVPLLAASLIPRDTAPGLVLNVNQRETVFPPPEYNQIPITINQLKQINPGIFASQIGLLPGSVHGVDESNVQCVAYHDQAGTQVASCPFNAQNVTTLSTSVTDIGSALCYLVFASANDVVTGDC